MFKKINLNWHALWRKGVGGLVFGALMGYTYKLNQQFDEAVDAKYPDKRKEIEEDPAS